MIYILLTMVAALAALNAYASRLSLRSRLNDRSQKKAQLLLIWLLPLLGAFLTIQALKGSARGSGLGRGGASMEPEQAWLYSGHGGDCQPGETGCGE